MKIATSVVAAGLLWAACAAWMGCSGQTTAKGDGGTSGSSSGGSSGGSGSSSGGSSGGSGSSSGVITGCGSFMTTTSTVDPNLCMAQLASTTFCMGSPCSWSVEVPCSGGGDAGVPDAGGNPPCMEWCISAAPAGASNPAGFCQVTALDGGAMTAQCGGCGI